MEQFSLKWNDFQQSVVTNFTELRDDHNFSNVTVSCDGNQSIEAHKIILAASSPVFQDILINNKHSHPFVYMRGVKYKDLLSVIDFIYHGQVTLKQDNLENFMNLAIDLQLKGLAEQYDYKESLEQDVKKVLPVDLPIVIDDKENDEIPKLDSAVKNNPGSSIPDRSILSNNDNSVIVKEEEELNRTIDSMVEKVNGEWKCSVCGKIAMTKQNLRGHIEYNHTEGLPNVCNFCGKEFKSRRGLHAHKHQNHKSK